MRQLMASKPKAIITVAQIARIAFPVLKNSPAAGLPVVVIEDGTGPIPEGTVPFKVRIEINQTSKIDGL